MYRLFIEHKQHGRYCIMSFPNEQQAIESAKQLLAYPQNHKTACEILDDDGNIVWKYPDKSTLKKAVQSDTKTFSAVLPTDEYNQIMAVLKAHGLTKAEFIRQAIKNLEGSDNADNNRS